MFLMILTDFYWIFVRKTTAFFINNLSFFARLESLVECVGLVVGRVAVVLWSRCGELPTASLANQARV